MSRNSILLFNGNKKANTFIGGVSGVITSASDLATALAISVGYISNFKIVGSDIQCYISTTYTIPGVATGSTFYCDNSYITYYIDSENKVTNLGNNAFFRCTAFNSNLTFLGVITLTGSYIGRATAIPFFNFKNCTSIGNNAFYDDLSPTPKTYYIPNCLTMGASTAYNNVFYYINGFSIIYTNPYLQTCNAGAPDGDLTYATGRAATVRYVTNYTIPSKVTDLSVDVIYHNSIRLEWSIPSSTNAIDYYLIQINGVENEIKYYENSAFIVNLTNGLSYDFTVVSVDIFLNKSAVSSTVTQTINGSANYRDNIVSYYKMNGNSNDAVGGNSGLPSPASLAYTPGKIDDSGVFVKASTSKITTVSATKLDIVNDSTISFWVKLTTLSADSNFFDCGSFTGWGVVYALTDGKVRMYYTPYGSSYINFTTVAGVITTGSWIHVVLVRNYTSNTMKLYVNNVEIISHTTSGGQATPTGTMIIGSGYKSCVDGFMDDFIILNKALNTTEISDLYTQGNSGNPII